eukprot:2262164-Rhodomonas_salina.1
MSGTDLAYGGMISLRAGYGMSGTDLEVISAYTDIAYAATRCPRMALSAYARAMQCPVLTSRMGLSAYVLAMECPVLSERMVRPVPSGGGEHEDPAVPLLQHGGMLLLYAPTRSLLLTGFLLRRLG